MNETNVLNVLNEKKIEIEPTSSKKVTFKTTLKCGKSNLSKIMTLKNNQIPNSTAIEKSIVSLSSISSESRRSYVESARRKSMITFKNLNETRLNNIINNKKQYLIDNYQKASNFTNKYNDVNLFYLNSQIKKNEKEFLEKKYKNKKKNLSFYQLNNKKLDIIFIILICINLILSFLYVIVNMKNTNQYLKEYNFKKINSLNDIETILKKINQKRKNYFKESLLLIINIIINIINEVILIYQDYINNQNELSTQNDQKIIRNNATKRNYRIYSNKTINNNCCLKLTNFFNILKYSFSTNYINHLINILFIIPFFNKFAVIRSQDIIYTLNVNYLIFILNLSKIYLIINKICAIKLRDYILFNSICNENHILFDKIYILKFYLISHSKMSILICFCVINLLVAFIVKILEFMTFKLDEYKDNEYDLNNYYNDLWICLISSYSLGSLHFKPKNIFSRIILFMHSIFAITLNSMLIIELFNYFKFNENESILFNKLRKIFSPKNKEHKASEVIKGFLLLNKLTKKGINKIKNDNNLSNKNGNFDDNFKLSNIHINNKTFYANLNDEIDDTNSNSNNNNSNNNYYWTLFAYLLIIKNSVKNFKDFYKTSRRFGVPVNQVLKTVKNNLHHDVDYCIKLLSRNDELEYQLRLIKNQQENIINNLQNAYDMQKNLAEYFVNVNNKIYKRQRNFNRIRITSNLNGNSILASSHNGKN